MNSNKPDQSPSKTPSGSLPHFLDEEMVQKEFGLRFGPSEKPPLPMRRVCEEEIPAGQLPTYEQMAKLYEYKDGILYRRAYNRVRAVTTADNTGYIKTQAYCRSFQAHRIIWLLCTGEWPKGVIDHIDGNPLNNKIENLRDVTQEINSKGFTSMRPGESGQIGVTRYYDGWAVNFAVNKRQVTISGFTHLEDAIEIRKMAEQAFGYNRN